MAKGVRQHGFSIAYPAEFQAWKNAILRCHKRHAQAWANYGGRGIRVCAEWREPSRGIGFKRFLDHIGPRPSATHSLDRIDNNKGYEPGNVRWATRAEQHANRRTTVTTTDFIETVEAYRLYGVSVATISDMTGRTQSAVYRVLRGETR